MGPFNDGRVDYPDYAHKVAKKVKSSKSGDWQMVCGWNPRLRLPQRSQVPLCPALNKAWL